MTADDIPPHVRIIQMGMGYRLSLMLRAAAHFRIADHLADGPQPIDTLAEITRTQPLALYRVMRVLADAGIFIEDEAKRFALTELGAALKSDAPGAARTALLFTAGDQHIAAWNKLEETLVDGEPGIEKTYGQSFFEYLSARPEKLAQFNETMVGLHGRDAPAIAAAFDFARFDTIVDVGGGIGERLASILTQHPNVRGVLFDQPQVIADARERFETGALAERLSFVTGDFFESVPGGGDAYLLSHIIHDWREDEACAILANCRAAMTPAARLLLIELVLPQDPTPHPGKMMDVAMLVMMGGRERTEGEYAALLADAGFRLVNVTPTGTPASVIEAEAV